MSRASFTYSLLFLHVVVGAFFPVNRLLHPLNKRNSLPAAMEARSKELQLEEEKVDGARKELDRKEEEPDKALEVTKWKSTALGAKVEALELLLKKVIPELRKLEKLKKELEAKEKEIELKSAAIEEKAERVRKESEKAEEAASRKSSELKAREEAFELLMKKEIVELKKEINGEKASVEAKEKEVALRSAEIEEKAQETELLMKKEIAERRKMEKLKEEIESEKASLEVKLKDIEEREEELESLGGYIMVRAIRGRKVEKEAEAKVKEIEEQWIELRKKQAEFEVRMVELKEKEIREKERQSRELEMVGRHREVDMEGKKLAEGIISREAEVKQVSGPPLEVVDPLNCSVSCSSMDNTCGSSITVCVIMNGKDLQIFLNEHCSDCDSLKREVESALKRSSDPAKLVLEAMEGFYPPHLKKGGVEFEEGVIRRNCMMLLEWLTELSPDIKPPIGKEAKQLGCNWKPKMKSDVEVLAFLQLLAAFGMASEFYSADIVKWLCSIAHCSQAPVLLRDLDFTDKMLSVIQKLLDESHQAEAAGLISAFELSSEFPRVASPKDDRSSQLAGAKRSWSDARSEGNHIEIRDGAPLASSSLLAEQQQQPETLSTGPVLCSSAVTNLTTTNVTAFSATSAVSSSATPQPLDESGHKRARVGISSCSNTTFSPPQQPSQFEVGSSGLPAAAAASGPNAAYASPYHTPTSPPPPGVLHHNQPTPLMPHEYPGYGSIREFCFRLRWGGFMIQDRSGINYVGGQEIKFVRIRRVRYEEACRVFRQKMELGPHQKISRLTFRMPELCKDGVWRFCVFPVCDDVGLSIIYDILVQKPSYYYVEIYLKVV